ncbi:uncharacterized protein LOC128709165 [Anopheles marshallii]|uniref:uncharacterized protein LOC128709165 n=1 Tax=Anopheles marshallii TaxID=1521116 RepID=UPI00237A9E34|nr:uncharacterized protein LOC128709165 [Anopheles marshallii]
MVFASYNSASYLLPLDNDQSVSFYRNENRLFPTAIGPSAGGVAPPPGRNNSTTSANDMSITDMLTAAYHHEMQQQHPVVGGSGGGASGENITAGDCPFGRVQSPAAQQQQQQQQQHQSHQPQQLPVQQYHRFGGTIAMCDDFQPVGYFNGSSNGYYGFVPSLAPTGGDGGGGAGGHTSNNNVLPGAAVNNNCHPPATAANVNGHLSAIDFHGNQHHISCNDAGEQNNNNNNNNDGDDTGIFHVQQPFPVQRVAQKRKEFNQPLQHEDEAMDTNVQLAAAVGQQYPKRRKTDTDQNAGMGGFPVTTSGPFPGSNSGVSYQHQVEIHEPTVDAMECQDQPAQQHPAVTLQSNPNGFHTVDIQHPAGQQPTSKIQRRDILLNSFIGARDDRVAMPCPASVPGLPVCLDRTARYEHDKKGRHGWDLDLFHSLHGTGGGYR